MDASSARARAVAALALVLAAGMYLLSDSIVCTPSGFTTDAARTPVEVACLYVGDLGPESEVRYVHRLCALLDETGLCAVDVFPGTVLMGAFDE